MSGSSQSSALAEAAEIASIVAAVGVAGVIGIIYRAAVTGLRITFFSRRDLAGRLDRLACGVTGEYVTSLFGPPVFRRHVSEIRGEPADLSDRIYRTRHAWVQAIVSEGDDAVQCFSITATDPKFRFRIRRRQAAYDSGIFCSMFFNLLDLYDRNQIAHSGGLELSPEQEGPATWFIASWLLKLVLTWFAEHPQADLSELDARISFLSAWSP